jgi:hypothetical protein
VIIGATDVVQFHGILHKLDAISHQGSASVRNNGNNIIASRRREGVCFSLGWVR